MSDTFVQKILNNSDMIKMMTLRSMPYKPRISPYIETPNGVIFAFRKTYSIKRVDYNISLQSMYDFGMREWPKEIAINLEEHITSKAHKSEYKPEIEQLDTAFISYEFIYKSDIESKKLKYERHHMSPLDLMDGVFARVYGVRCYKSSVNGLFFCNIGDSVLSEPEIEVTISEEKGLVSLDFAVFAGIPNMVQLVDYQNELDSL